ncbi:hypothetical protein ACJX0J_008926, partial [Zea mays]
MEILVLYDLILGMDWLGTFSPMWSIILQVSYHLLTTHTSVFQLLWDDHITVTKIHQGIVALGEYLAILMVFIIYTDQRSLSHLKELRMVAYGW